MVRALSTVLVLLSVSGCASIIVGSKAWFEARHWQCVAPEASLDLSCPAEELGYVPRRTFYSVCVSGCGKHITYRYVEDDGPSAWVMQTAVREGACPR